MIDFVRECGMFGWLGLALILAGVAVMVTHGRKTGNMLRVAVIFSLALIASGGLGFGLGMVMVEKAVMGLPEADLARRVTYLAIGGREAAGNLVLAGIGCLVMLLTAGILKLVSKPA